MLIALCVATVWGCGVKQYAPQWRVGDWWVVKVWQQFEYGSYLWHHERYDVAGIAKVDDRECFVLKTAFSRPKATSFRTEMISMCAVTTGAW